MAASRGWAWVKKVEEMLLLVINKCVNKKNERFPVGSDPGI